MSCRHYRKGARARKKGRTAYFRYNLSKNRISSECHHNRQTASFTQTSIISAAAPAVNVEREKKIFRFRHIRSRLFYDYFLSFFLFLAISRVFNKCMCFFSIATRQHHQQPAAGWKAAAAAVDGGE
jgi:hypothetical protein